MDPHVTRRRCGLAARGTQRRELKKSDSKMLIKPIHR